MKLLIYLPALNEAKSIQRVLASLPRSLDEIEHIEYLVVDDGSTDETARLAGEAGAHVISHGRNRGVGAAFHSALKFSLENGIDLLIGMDADGQFSPTDIPALIQPILEGRAEMVMGNRFTEGLPQHMSRVKYWGNQRMANLIHYIIGYNFQDVSCGFRAYSREALLRLNLFGEFTYTHETILSLLYQGQRVLECPIQVKYYPERKSRVAGSLYLYAAQTSKILFRVMLDYHPMRMLGLASAILGFIGIGFIFFMLGHYILSGTYTPYKSFGFIGLGFFLFGALVLLIAFVADMLNRVRRNQDKILYELKKISYGNSPIRYYGKTIISTEMGSKDDDNNF